MFEYASTPQHGDKLVLRRHGDDPQPVALSVAQARAVMIAAPQLQGFVHECRDFAEMERQWGFQVDGGRFAFNASQLELILQEIKEVSNFARRKSN